MPRPALLLCCVLLSGGCPASSSPPDVSLEERIERLDALSKTLDEEREQGVVNPVTVALHAQEHRAVLEQLAADPESPFFVAADARRRSEVPALEAPAASEGPIQIQKLDIPSDASAPPAWLPLAVAGGFGGGVLMLAFLAYGMLYRSGAFDEAPEEGSVT